MAVSKATTEGRQDAVWFTSCRVPTATATAERIGLLADLSPAEATRLRPLREFEAEAAEDHHQTHDINLFREGGNIPPIWARSRGAKTRLIGLTWIEEGQVIIARPGSGIGAAKDLRGLRAAIPSPRAREPQLQRPNALHGIAGALSTAGLELEDVRIVDVGTGDNDIRDFWARRVPARRNLPALDVVANGEADIAYAVGPAAADYARSLDLEVVIDLDRAPNKRSRVNLGSPRALTADQDTLDREPGFVVDYLVRLIQAADWAHANNAAFVASIVADTGASEASVRAIYGPQATSTLRPLLTDELLGLYDLQKAFLLKHRFIENDFDLFDWADRAPLEAAYGKVAALAAKAA